MALKVSKDTLGEFLRSSIWSDLQDIIEERIALYVEELKYESPNEDVWVDIRRVAAARAKLGELEYLFNLPKFLFDNYDGLSRMEEEIEGGE